jgi:glycosyltransferase involved in cell wall biosynthesis
MFIICESIAWGAEHVPFNSALLMTIRLAYPNDVIRFYAEESHLEKVRERIGPQNAFSIVWRKLKLPLRHSNFYARLVLDFKNTKFLLNELNERFKDGVLVITGNASILRALKYYLGSTHKKKKVQVILHGDFSTLRRTPRKSILNPLYYIGSLKTALRLSGYEKLQHIVLEESVRDAILKQMPFLGKSVSVLDHPVPIDKQNVLINKLKPPIHFGFLGRASEKKGFSEYLNVASEISKLFSGLVQFHHIGRVSGNYRLANHLKMVSLCETSETQRMNRNEYVNRLMNLHFVCLFFDKYYETSASGVLLDSIAFKKPIIATQLPIFMNIQKRYGDIGYLCRNNEFNEIIGTIIKEIDSDRYKQQVENLSKVKTSRTPEKLATKYLELVKLL